MNKQPQHISLFFYAIHILIATVIILDLFIPGKITHSKIIEVKSTLQQYYNPASNHHYSYKVITENGEFSVAEDFAKMAKVKKDIEYSVSRIFKEVNWYRFDSSDNRGFYSLRIFSSLIIPLLTIIAIIIAYRFKKKISTLVFVLQSLLVANLIYLLL